MSRIKSDIPIFYTIIGFLLILVIDLVFWQVGNSTPTYILWSSIKSWIGFLLFAFVVYRYLVKQQQAKLLVENHDKQAILINSISDFIVFKDDQGRWSEVNNFGQKLYNLEKEDVLGRTDLEMAELFPQFFEHFKYCYDTDESAWKIGKPIHVDELLIVGEEERLFDVLKIPMFHSDGSRKGLYAIGRDITDLRKSEELLIKNEKLSIVGQLAAGVAHEIRNPLTSLKGFVNLCKENEGDKELYLKIMHNELERINDIVDELLVIARPQKVPMKKNDINKLLDGVTILMETEASISGVSLQIHKEEHLPLISCGECQIKQVLINIIKNAIEASKADSTVTVTTSSTKENIMITIEDEGCGMDNADISKLGDPFFTLKENGTGLGMMVSLKIIEAHQGTLSIESEINQGSTVSISLPIKQTN